MTVCIEEGRKWPQILHRAARYSHSIRIVATCFGIPNVKVFHVDAFEQSLDRRVYKGFPAKGLNVWFSGENAF
jgi:hypothetical protein